MLKDQLPVPGVVRRLEYRLGAEARNGSHSQMALSMCKNVTVSSVWQISAFSRERGFKALLRLEHGRSSASFFLGSLVGLTSYSSFTRKQQHVTDGCNYPPSRTLPDISTWFKDDVSPVDGHSLP